MVFKKDVKKIDYNIYDKGHFALEEDGNIIIKKIRSFMKKVVIKINLGLIFYPFIDKRLDLSCFIFILVKSY